MIKITFLAFFCGALCGSIATDVFDNFYLWVSYMNLIQGAIPVTIIISLLCVMFTFMTPAGKEGNHNG